MVIFYQTSSESCPYIVYIVFLNTSISEWLLPMTDYYQSNYRLSIFLWLSNWREGKYHEKQVGALIADFFLLLDHLADGVVVFFNRCFHGCDIVKWMCLTHPYPLSRGEDKKVINNPVFAALWMTGREFLMILDLLCYCSFFEWYSTSGSFKKVASSFQW